MRRVAQRGIDSYELNGNWSVARADHYHPEHNYNPTFLLGFACFLHDGIIMLSIADDGAPENSINVNAYFGGGSRDPPAAPAEAT